MTSQPDENLPTRWMKSTGYRDMWVDTEEDPRETGAEDATDERGILLDYLRRYRLTLEMKCADLDAEQLARRSVPPSTMSLLGLVRHMADVERNWFRREMNSLDAPPYFWTDEDPDGDFDGAVADPQVVEEAWRTWRTEVSFAEEYVDRTPDLSTPGKSGYPLRDILVHMIEEYARHCGHADLLRERVDGRIGQ
ncbi:MAG TPA: DinB family protein [Nocardioidaceae bacterium]|nr:DinB family protein [Nocardioidaceae bacterium]